jgi:hypothetical protein
VRVVAAAPTARNASSFTVVAYLYDVPPWGEKSTLISHGPQSVWSVGDGDGQPHDVRIRLRTLCWAVNPGHKIAIGFDMYSNMYKSANTAEDLTLTFAFNGQSSVELPFTAASLALAT